MDNKEEIYVPYEFKKKCLNHHWRHEMNLIEQLNVPIFDKKERKSKVYLCLRNVDPDGFYNINKEKIDKDYLKLLSVQLLT